MGQSTDAIIGSVVPAQLDLFGGAVRVDSEREAVAYG